MINPLKCHFDLVNLFQWQLMVTKTKVQGVENFGLPKASKISSYKSMA
jgi:hypothetical protein